MKKLVGEQVPESGIYEVTHAAHRVPHQVTLVQGEYFPPCEKCDGAVTFKVVQSAPSLSRGQGLIVLRALPVMIEADEETDAAAAAS